MGSEAGSHHVINMSTSTQFRQGIFLLKVANSLGVRVSSPFGLSSQLSYVRSLIASGLSTQLFSLIASGLSTQPTNAVHLRLSTE